MQIKNILAAFKKFVYEFGTIPEEIVYFIDLLGVGRNYKNSLESLISKYKYIDVIMHVIEKYIQNRSAYTYIGYVLYCLHPFMMRTVYIIINYNLVNKSSP